ncbi:MAG: ABC transporter permease [[Clostridium] scindens]
MIKNNNTRIISRMAKRNLVSGRRKNLIMIFAILLSTFLLFTILTVGSTYFKMQRIQDVRMNGGDMDAYIYGGFTEKQKSVCEENPDIALVGQEAIAGWGVKTDQDDTLHTVFVWADEVMWDKLQEPAREWVKGTYPKKDNEVMATKEALEDCGLEGLDVGDSFTITYGDGTGEHTKEFTITGMWGGFGTKKVFNVSRSFFDQSGFQLTDYGRGFLYLKYASSIIPQKTQDVLEKSLELGEKQRLIYMSDSASSVKIMAGMAGLILITCISAYLLIYNILYLSVSGNTRYYGLLQTVGMTGRQVYALMKKRMLYIGAVGMTLGILLGSAASFLVIPWVVKTLGIHEEDIAVAFHPAIFLLCLILISLTIWLGGQEASEDSHVSLSCGSAELPPK